ncbi:PAS domain S-box protein [Marinifilum sp. RC60d5]|uniref:PAS domain S-box protein n=1 Tax=Marinifilum sp. RC60d5 TaxID=3458414 RepID=UPI0040375BC9
MTKQYHHNCLDKSDKNVLNYKKKIEVLEKELEQLRKEKKRYAQDFHNAHSVSNYELLFKYTGLGVICRNQMGKIIYANAAASNILGVSNSRLLNIESFEPAVKNIYKDGTSMTGSMHPAKKVFKSGKEIANELMGVYNYVSQCYVWINLTAIPLIDHLGQVEMVYTVFEDISDRIKMDELLADNMARSKALLRTIPDCIIRIDKHGKLLDFHGEDLKLFLVDKAVIGKNVKLLFKPDFYQFFTDKQDQLKSNKELFVFEYQNIWPNSKKLFFEIRMSWNENGEITAIIRDVTATKKSEQKIEEAKRQHSTLMGNLNGIVYRCLADKNWTMLFLSDGVYNLTGYKADELLNNSFISFGDLIYPEDRKNVEEVINKAMLANERFSVEYRVLTKKGKLKWVYEQGLTIKDTSNKILFIEGYISDITDRKQAQEDIESREAKYRLLFNSLNQAVFVHPWKESVFQTFVEVNDMAIHRYGYTRQEFLNLSPSNLIKQGELSGAELERIRRSLKNFGQVRFETRHLTKSGEIFPVVLYASIIELNGEKFIQSIVRDVSEQKKAAAKLKHRSQIEKLISSVSKELISSDINKFDKVIDRALQSISEILYADRSYIFLLDNYNSNAVNSHEWCRENVPNVLGEQKEIPKGLLHWWIRKFENHEQIYISSIADLPKEALLAFGINKQEKSGLYLPIFYQEQLLGFIGFEVLQSNAGLNKTDFYLLYTFADLLAGVFYRRNFEEQLIIAKEKAEESDRLKSAFLASMSHELRTPLNAIIGFSGLVEKDINNENYQKWNKIINSSGKHLLNIIESIFDVSLLQAKEARLEEVEFSLSEFYSTLQQYLKSQLKKHNKTNLAAKMFSFSNSEVFIKADKTKLLQLLTNFLNNAIKYTEQGDIEYTYRVMGNDVLFSVSDTGIGIKDEHRRVIFDVFRQIEDSMGSIQSGVGLGLAICKEISDLMNGEIWLESEEGKGSTFYFKLFDVVVNKHEQPRESKVKPPSLSGKTILVVEDVEFNYLLINEMLSSTSAKVLWAKNGKEGVRLVNSESSIELILMDIKMPLMDGYEASRRISNTKPNIPIIAQTAYALSNDKKDIIEAGFIDYIPKPINEALLYELLRRYLSPKMV